MTAWTWQPYALAGGAAAGLAALALLLWQATRRRERPLRARDLFQLPARIDGFTVVRLLRALQTSPLVQLTDVRRQELQQEIQRVQASCFDDSTATLSETELRDLARRWLKTAC